MAAIAANVERIQQQMQSELEKFKAIQKGDCNYCNRVRYFAKYPRRLTFQCFFCGTGSNLVIVPLIANVCFQFYDNLLTDSILRILGHC